MADYTRWSRAVARVPAEAVDPAIGFPFRISPHEQIATAGSCFAQHISRRCREQGFNYRVVEPGYLVAPGSLQAKYNYGTYPARFGNIYTPRQLCQLFTRAFGTFIPREIAWSGSDGSFVDPFRPHIQPGDFISLEELVADRRQHLQAVRRMFQDLDVFIFTLGMTEMWFDAEDGAVFPLCPGVAGGSFESARHRFMNLTLRDVVADLEIFIGLLQAINPTARVIVTVSPVPLIATALDRHVLVSTTSSKSTLRVACDEICARHSHVAYFPAYEIVTGPQARGAYFAEDLRCIREEGVDHVMRIFFDHATTGHARVIEAEQARPNTGLFVETMCQEELIESALVRRDATV